MDDIHCSGITFIRNFDSANLARVEAVTPTVSVLSSSTSQCNTSSNLRSFPEIPDNEFNIWTTPDCGGTEFENGNRTWFHFGVRANFPCLLIKFNVVDLNKQAKMYSQGMCPVFKVVPSRNSWDRIKDKPTYTNEDEIFTLSFKYRTPENPQAITYFAFTYPFSYGDIQKMLSNVDSKFSNALLADNDDIYYVRECVCFSLDKRRVDLLTITSKRGMSNVRETRLKKLFPDTSVPRPFKFPEKKVIFISARVHPGETPSSFVFNGLLHLLLNRDDLVAIALRRMYVFKLIPCLNPDGVARGHYRTDSRGVNLNRMYLNPSILLHPSIYAARAIIRYHHYGVETPDSITLCSNCSETSSIKTRETEDRSGNVMSSIVSNMSLEENSGKEQSSFLKLKKLCTICGSPLNTSVVKENSNNDKINEKGDLNPEDSGLFLYMDLHGHASKKGIFLYGNHFDTPEQNVECMLLAKLMSINNHNFHFTACNFSERNMFVRDKRDGTSRAGSGRVAISSLTGLTKCYTLECNYNTGRIVNILPPTVKERQQKGYVLPVPPKYSPTVFEEVGRSLGASILDLTGNNPLTRLPHSEFHSLNGVVNWLRTNCIQEADETGSNMKNSSKAKVKSTLSQEGKCSKIRSNTASNSTISNPTTSSNTKMNISIKPRPSSVPIERKENVDFIEENLKLTSSSTPSTLNCSNKIQRKKSNLRIHKTMLKKTKSKLALSLKCKSSPLLAGEKTKSKTKQPVIVNGNRKLTVSSSKSTKNVQNETNKSIFPAWKVEMNNSNNEPCCSSNSNSQQNINFSKNTVYNKKHSGASLRRIITSESSHKIEKVKKRKRLVKKI